MTTKQIFNSTITSELNCSWDSPQPVSIPACVDLVGKLSDHPVNSDFMKNQESETVLFNDKSKVNKHQKTSILQKVQCTAKTNDAGKVRPQRLEAGTVSVLENSQRSSKVKKSAERNSSRMTNRNVLKISPRNNNESDAVNKDNNNQFKISKFQKSSTSVMGTSKHLTSSNNSNIDTIITKDEHLVRDNNISNVDDGNDDDERLLLSSWGLPDVVLQQYKKAGIEKLFLWQAECLCTGKVLERGNLVYSAPTSAGKTMVAELLMLKSVVETKMKALFVFPFVSVAREKAAYLQRMFQNASIRVGGYYGNSSPAGGLACVDIAVCTIEKANNLVNRLLEEGNLNQLGCVVIDELHMVGDRHRGYLLELLITKIRYVTALKKNSNDKNNFQNPLVPTSSMTTSSPVQIIGMSATLPNLDLLAEWLDADLFTTDFRPVPLLETVKIGLDILNEKEDKIRTLPPSCFKNDEDHVIHLCSETVMGDRCSVLVFCPTKNWCEKLADTIAREFFNLLTAQQQKTEGDFILDKKSLMDVLELLQRSPSGLDSSLGKMVRCGVAYHHAGLTFEERDIIEGAFRSGTLKVLVATSTLSSGVNLPARRVIIRSPMFYGGCIDAMVYKQMIGRAGRKGVDIKGESVLVCKTSERRLGFELLNSKLPPISSCLVFNPKEGLSSSMKRAILEIIVSKVASSLSEIDLYARCTMLSASLTLESKKREGENIADDENKLDAISVCIEYLKENEFIQLHKDGEEDETYVASRLGCAVVSSGLSPEEGLKIFVEFQRASRCFVLENDLHLVYLVTPVYMQDQFTVDWYHYLCLWESLSLELKRVGEVVGVQDRFLSKAVTGKFAGIGDRSVERLVAIHKRFYMALALFDLINESPLACTCIKFKVNKGSMQALQQSASTFAGMATSFCSKLGWHNMEALLIHFQSRLSFGVQQELVDLVRISLLTAQLARRFYLAGYVNVSSLASAPIEKIEQVLRNISPFSSKKRFEGESEWELEERMRTSCCFFVAGGNRGLTEREAAEEIVKEAKRIVEDDLLKLGVVAFVRKDDDKLLVSQDDGAKKSEILSTNIISKGRRRSKTNHVSPGLTSTKLITKVKSRKKNLSRLSQDHNPGNDTNKSRNPDNDTNRDSSILTPPVIFTKSQKHITASDECKLKKSDQTNVVGSEVPDEIKQGNKEKFIEKVSTDVSSSTIPTKLNDIQKMIFPFDDDDDIIGDIEIKKPACKIFNKSINQKEQNIPNYITAATPHSNIVLPTSSRSTVKSTDVRVDGENSNMVEDVADYRDDSKLNVSSEMNFNCNAVDDFNFSVDSQLMLLVSENVETPKNVENVETLKTTLVASKKNFPVNNDVVVATSTPKHGITESTTKKKSSELVSKNIPISKNADLNDRYKMSDVFLQFHEEILAGSQIVGDLMFNTFNTTNNKHIKKHISGADDDNNASPTRGKKTSTPKNKPRTPGKNVSSKKTKKVKINDINEEVGESFSDIKLQSVSKQYCRINFEGSGSKRSVTLFDSHNKKNSSSTKKREVKKPRSVESPEPDLFETSACEKRQFGSILLDSRMPYSEELFEDEDDILMVNDEIKKLDFCEIDDDFDRKTAENDKRPRGRVLPDLVEYTQLRKVTPVCQPDSVNKYSKENPANVNKSTNLKNSEVYFENSTEISFDTSELFDSFHCTPDKPNDQRTEQKDFNSKKKNKIVESKHLNVATTDNVFADNLITPTAVAQLMDSGNFDDISFSCNDFTNNKQVFQEQKVPATSKTTSNGSTPGAGGEISLKKFKSFEASACNLNADVEMIMRSLCGGDDDDVGGGGGVLMRKKKAPKRCNSSESRTSATTPSDKKSALHWSRTVEGKRMRIEGDNENNILIKQHIGSTTERQQQNSTATTKLIHNESDHMSFDYDSDTFIPPTPPRSPEKDPSKMFCSGSSTPRRLLVGVVRPSPKFQGKDIFNNPSHNFSEFAANEINQAKLISDQITEKKLKEKDETISGTKLFCNKNLNNIFNKDSETSDTITNADTSKDIPPATCESFTIYDVTSDRCLFETFFKEWKSRPNFSLCIACDKVPSKEQVVAISTVQIGAKFSKKKSDEAAERVEQKKKESNESVRFAVQDSDLKVVGFAVSWDALDVYYVSLLPFNEYSDLDRSMSAPDQDPTLSIDERLQAFKNVLENTQEGVQIVAFDSKSQFKVLSGACGILTRGVMLDPKVACWILDPGMREKPLHGLVASCCPQFLYLLEDVESSSGLSSLGMTPSEMTSPRLRSCIESLLARLAMDSLKIQLSNMKTSENNKEETNSKIVSQNLWNTFVNIEMPVVILLAKMELNGMGFDDKECERQKCLILKRLKHLEDTAYHLAGHTFSLTSPDDVSRVLFIELGLPPSGEPGVAAKPKSKRGGQSARPVASALPRFSAAKDVLEKLKKLHPLPGVIMEWRRLTAVLAKNVFPLQRASVLEVNVLNMGRIHGVTDTHTATGRVTMREPNLQNVPKDFSVDEKFSLSKEQPADLINESMNFNLSDDDEDDSSNFSVSMRHAFVAFEGGILLAADYSQLELRVIAHMSGDKKLIDLLNRGGDVFKGIAAQLKGVSEEEVTDIQRQHAKQVCYGMIYGIGGKSLGQQLGIDEDSASVFIETFKSKYKGIRTFLHETVHTCRRNGFVETITGRRRYLPSIKDENTFSRAHAERQAVNTTIQGSGADLVKMAMVKIDRELSTMFPRCQVPHRHNRNVAEKTGEPRNMQPVGAYLILQLHDEVIYEVNKAALPVVARVVKSCMENATKLSVVLPVKLKVGNSWGRMSDYVTS